MTRAPTKSSTGGQLLSSSEIHDLFQIFFDKLNPFAGVLDPFLHTPAYIHRRCPLLLKVVCAIASRYYEPRPELYPILMTSAISAAATSVIDAPMCVELVQAYVLMVLYSVPQRYWEKDRTWMYVGLAIRISHQLSLNKPLPYPPTAPNAPPPSPALLELQARQALNRSRTWLCVYNLDQSVSSQFGKPPTLREDFLVRHSDLFWREGGEYIIENAMLAGWDGEVRGGRLLELTKEAKAKSTASPFDVHLGRYTQLLSIVTDFFQKVYEDDPGPDQIRVKNVNLRQIAEEHDDRIRTFERETLAMYARDSDSSNPACVYRAQLMPFLGDYYRLTAFSICLSRSIEEGGSPADRHYLIESCFKAASALVNFAVEILPPSGYLQYSIDAHFGFMTFAAGFLLKLLKPHFTTSLTPTQRQSSLTLIRQLIQKFRESAVDEKHTPGIYADLLEKMLNGSTEEEKWDAEKLVESNVCKGRVTFPTSLMCGEMKMNVMNGRMGGGTMGGLQKMMRGRSAATGVKVNGVDASMVEAVRRLAVDTI